jgi:hypothetical protein
MAPPVPLFATEHAADRPDQEEDGEGDAEKADGVHLGPVDIRGGEWSEHVHILAIGMPQEIERFVD